MKTAAKSEMAEFNALISRAHSIRRPNRDLELEIAHFLMPADAAFRLRGNITASLDAALDFFTSLYPQEPIKIRVFDGRATATGFFREVAHYTPAMAVTQLILEVAKAKTELREQMA